MADQLDVSQVIAQIATANDKLLVSQVLAQVATSENKILVSQVLCQVAYSDVSAGPTQAQLMRHGTWFGSGGVKQRMWWAK
jgi:hypothetical protein